MFSQYDLGRMYADGRGVEKDYKQAMVWFRKAAEQGYAESQCKLGQMFRQGEGVKQDFQQAFEWFSKSAEQGNIEAQVNLGGMYSLGQGVKQDANQAAVYYRKAAEQGDVRAQYVLGIMYHVGEDIKQDYKQAAFWFQKAAEQGDADSQDILGKMYLNGQGIEKDSQQAAQWLHKAADQGKARSQASLGMMYYYGKGVKQDYIQAVKWYRRSAEQGEAGAQVLLGMMYDEGKGVVEDYIDAYKWFLLAGMNGQDVVEFKTILQQKMTAAQIAEAQRLAKEFVPRKEGEGGNEVDRPKDLKTTGTGFFIDAKGTILTANHVIEKAKTIRIMAGDKILDAKVVAADAGLDIAILKVEGQGFEWLPIAASAPVKAGEKIFTVGYPNYAIQGTEPKYTEGVVNSVTGAMNNPRLFQVSAQVQPGNSGGPLVTEAGQVIGVVVQRLSDLGMLEATGMVAQSVNYAVKSAFVLPLLEGVEGWTRPEGKAEKTDRSAIIERARKAAVMVMAY